MSVTPPDRIREDFHGHRPELLVAPMASPCHKAARSHHGCLIGNTERSMALEQIRPTAFDAGPVRRHDDSLPYALVVFAAANIAEQHLRRSVPVRRIWFSNVPYIRVRSVRPSPIRTITPQGNSPTCIWHASANPSAHALTQSIESEGQK